MQIVEASPSYNGQHWKKERRHLELLSYCLVLTEVYRDAIGPVSMAGLPARREPWRGPRGRQAAPPPPRPRPIPPTPLPAVPASPRGGSGGRQATREVRIG